MLPEFQTIQLVYDMPEWIAERFYNRIQDNARSGYQNLGEGSNTFTIQPSQIGDQFVNGQAGDDRIFLFGQGDHTVHSGSGNDFVVGGAGNDTFFGGSNDDTLEGGSGFDKLEGGSGQDQLWGGANADYLYGGSGHDFIMGDHDGSSTSQQGNDTLIGGGGNDTLSGGGGADKMSGGNDADVFRFDTHRDLSIGHTDVILDFSRAEDDMIDLRMIDANLNSTSNQAFVFSTAPSTQAGRLWLSDVFEGQQTVFMNIDGGAADVSIIVRFDDPAMTSLQATDFYL